MTRSIRSIVIPLVRFTASGGNRVLCRLAAEWHDKGLDVAFLVLDPQSRPTFETTARVIYCQEQTAQPRADSAVAKPLREIWALARGLRRVASAFDAVLGNHSFTAMACVLAGVRRKTFYYVQGYDPEVLAARRTLRAYAAAGVAALSYLVCRRQVTNSPHYFRYPLIRATEFIPPGVDTAVFFAKGASSTLSSVEIRIGIIGRLEPHKYRPVLKAFNAIREQHPACKLVVAYGNIPDSELAKCGEYEVVRPKNDRELSAFYRGCDVFLALTEFPEGAFYPPLEALASGTLLISNRFLFVNPDNSWVVDAVAEVPAAFTAMLHSSSQERLEKIERGVRDVSSLLNWATLAERFLQWMNGGMTRDQRTGAFKANQ